CRGRSAASGARFLAEPYRGRDDRRGRRGRGAGGGDRGAADLAADEPLFARSDEPARHCLRNQAGCFDQEPLQAEGSVRADLAATAVRGDARNQQSRLERTALQAPAAPDLAARRGPAGAGGVGRTSLSEGRWCVLAGAYPLTPCLSPE